MKKKILLSILILLNICHFANAQWITSGTNVYNSNTGYIGIGTSSPSSKLTIDAANNVADGITVKGTNGPFINLTSGSYSFQAGLATSATYYSNVAQQGDAVIRLSSASGTGNLIMGLAAGDFKFTTYNGGNSDYIQMIIKNGGNVGIGTSSPQAKLDVSGGIRSTSNIIYGSGLIANFTNAADQDINFTVTSPGAIDKYTLVAPSTSTNLAFGIGATEKMRINSAGNLLIGQSSQVNTSYKLDVAGNVRANQITVNTSGADFVFDQSYQLNSLTKTEAYINKNHHLSEIPSAGEMYKDGVNLGELNIKLLQKVEELTLYLIEKDKEISKLRTDVSKIKRQMQSKPRSKS